MLPSLRLALVAAYVGVWVLIVYGGVGPSSLRDEAQVTAALALMAAAHVALGALMRSWWAILLAFVLLPVAVPSTPDWPLMLIDVPVIAVLIAAGVGAAKLRQAATRRRSNGTNPV
jgi:hypothetical protein